MKKLLLLTAFAVFGFTVNAQNVSFGAKAGVNFATLTGSDVDNVDMRTSLHVGGVVNIGITEKFGIQPELLYSSQGYTADGDVTGKLDYISVPVMAEYKFFEGFSAQAGPQVAFNINDKIEVDGEEVGELDAESVDFGFAFGAQYKLKQGIFFQARYGLGLSDVVSDFTVKNAVFGISVGYMF